MPVLSCWVFFIIIQTLWPSKLFVKYWDYYRHESHRNSIRDQFPWHFLYSPGHLRYVNQYVLLKFCNINQTFAIKSLITFLPFCSSSQKILNKSDIFPFIVYVWPFPSKKINDFFFKLQYHFYDFHILLTLNFQVSRVYSLRICVTVN